VLFCGVGTNLRKREKEIENWHQFTYADRLKYELSSA
jgi:hypothetical protein